MDYSLISEYVLTIVFILFLFRYVYMYRSKKAELLDKLWQLSQELKISNDIENLTFDMDKFRFQITSIRSEDFINQEYFKNPIFKKLYKKYDEVKMYGLKFWRFEGLLYVFVIVIIILFYLYPSLMAQG